MKARESLLINFISDFSLEVSGDEAICFEASVEFRAKGIVRKIDTELQINTLEKTGRSVVYLLHPDIYQLNIPDTFPFDPKHFVYLRHSALIITGSNVDYGEFSVSLRAIDTSCTEQTLNELKAKKLN
jgi:hypothetical protein